MIYRVARKRMAVSFKNFYGKMWNGFCPNIGKHFLREILFQNNPPFKRLVCFYVLITEVLHVLNTLTLKNLFLKNWNFSWKTGVPFFSLEYSKWKWTFPYKTVPLKANVKANWMGSAKWTYHKESWQTLDTDYLIFFENFIWV